MKETSVAVPTHLRVVFRGIWVGTPETWSFGLHFSRDNTVGLDASLADVDTTQMKNKCKDFFLNGAAKIPSAAQLTDVRSYIIGTDNKMEGSPELVECTGENIKGVAGTIYPPQVALVMTHVAAERGPARFGRVFLPTSAPLDTDMRVSVLQTGMIRDAYVTFIKACSDQIDLDVTASAVGLNISQVGSAGHRQTIDHVECGRVLDTLRSRRRALVEERNVGGHIDW